jgi:hypothetical protein
LLVVGDLHGHIANFQSILKLADLANNPQRHLVLQELIHSEFFYPDGGDKSHQLVDLFSALKCQYPTRVHYIVGNHEIAQLTGRQITKGSAVQNTLFVEGVKHAYGSHAMEILQTYNELFRVCPHALRTENNVYVCHTLVPGKLIPQFDPACLLEEVYEDKQYLPDGMLYGLLWGRDTTQETADAFLRRVEADYAVTGHIASDEGYDVPNTKQIIVDCAASPAACILFNTTGPITFEQLRSGITVF